MQIRFIADVMLGRLAKWLRIMGYDVLYFNHITDKEIIDVALSDTRCILTRDKGIILRNSLKDITYYVKSSFINEQILEVVSYYRLDPLKNAFKRCILDVTI